MATFRERTPPPKEREKKVPNHRKTEKRSLSLLPPFFSVITSSRNGQAGPANVREPYTVRVIDLLLLCVCTVLSYTKNPTAEDDVFVSDETRGNERHPSRSISTFFFSSRVFFSTVANKQNTFGHSGLNSITSTREFLRLSSVMLIQAKVFFRPVFFFHRTKKRVAYNTGGTLS